MLPVAMGGLRLRGADVGNAIERFTQGNKHNERCGFVAEVPGPFMQDF